MASSNSLNYNGHLLPADQPLLTAGNRGFRYGDGLFETLLVQNDGIRLGDYHFDRLFAGMTFLRFDIPPSFKDRLTREILQLCEANGHLTVRAPAAAHAPTPIAAASHPSAHAPAAAHPASPPAAARVRLVIFRSDGILTAPPDPSPQYIIQSWPYTPEPFLPPQSFNDQGLHLGIFEDGRKACDTLSNIKSNNFLLYTLASAHAASQGLDDCLVLNSHDRIADSTIANLFYIRGGELYTPPLSEGCVAGVMRRHLLTALPQAGNPVHEQVTTVKDLLEADEIFLTNALKPMRPVISFRGRQYSSRLSALVYEQLIKTL